MRDEHRQDYDPGRGGWGVNAHRKDYETTRYDYAEEQPANKKRGRSPVYESDGPSTVRQTFGC